MVVERALAHARLGGDGIDAGRQPLAVEQPVGGLENALVQGRSFHDYTDLFTITQTGVI